MKPESLGSQDGGGFNTDDAKNAAILSVAGATGVVVGAAAGALRTEFQPIGVELSKDIHAEVSFTEHEGLTAVNYDNEISAPNAPVVTNLPGFRGVKVNITKPDLFNAVDQAINNPEQPKPASSKQLLSVAAKPGLAVQSVNEALTAEVVHGATAGLLVFVAGAVMIRKAHPVRRFHELVNRIRHEKIRKLAPWAATLSMSVVTAGCGYTGNQVLQNLDQPGAPLPGAIANRSALLKGATTKGSEISSRIQRILRTFDKGTASWTRIDAKLNMVVDEYEAGDGLLYRGDKSTQTVLNQTGVLCNEPFTKTVNNTIQKRFKPDITEDTGDRTLSGGRWPYERDCVKNLVANITSKAIVMGDGNHEGDEPTRWSIGKDSDYTRKVGGVYYISSPDPRANRWGKDTEKLSYKDLAALIGQQGSIIAERACEVEEKTGEKPRILAHTPEAGYEAILRGCASIVSSGHGIGHNDNKNTTRPSLKKFTALDGSEVYQLINVTAPGSSNNSSQYGGPGKDGATVIMHYNMPQNELTAAEAIIIKKDAMPEIKAMEMPEAKSPTQEMLDFVATNSKNSKKLGMLLDSR